MSSKHDIKKGLLDLLGEDRTILQNEIPRNVNSSYKVFLDLNMKELLIVFSPPLIFMIISGLIMALLDSLNMYMIFIILALGIFVWFILYGLLTITPISERKNIRMLDTIKMNQKFNNRQKVFFYEKDNNSSTTSEDD